MFFTFLYIYYPAGPPSNVCECQCLDVNGSATSEQSTSIRPANSCTCGMLLILLYNVYQQQ